MYEKASNSSGGVSAASFKGGGIAECSPVKEPASEQCLKQLEAIFHGVSEAGARLRNTSDRLLGCVPEPTGQDGKLPNPTSTMGRINLAIEQIQGQLSYLYVQLGRIDEL